MDWLRIDSGLPEHAKIAALADALDIDEDRALALVVRLLCWVARVRESGRLNGMKPREIAYGARLSVAGKSAKDVFDALTASRWLDVEADGLHVHDWGDLQAAIFASRERTRACRERRKRDGNVTDTSQFAHTHTDTQTDKATTPLTPLRAEGGNRRPRSMSPTELLIEMDRIRKRHYPDPVSGVDLKRMDSLRAAFGQYPEPMQREAERLNSEAQRASGGEA